MKKITFFIITILFTVKIFAQAEPPKYMATAIRFTKFFNANKPDSIAKDFSPEMKAALPGDKFNTTTTQLRDQLGQLEKTEFVKYNQPLAVYKATFKNGVFFLNISLNSKNQIQGLLLTPYQEPAMVNTKMDESITESSVLIKTLSVSLSGTLAMPKDAKGKVPVVLIIAGSGPVDRNGNSAKLNLATNDYKLIAEALGKAGIASLRYDKRMVGESPGSGKESELRFDDYCDDAISMVNFLKEDARFSKVIILGHSEGSLIGIVAANAADANALISVEGAGRPADKILFEQMKQQPAYIETGFKRVMDSLAHGHPQKSVDPALYFIIRPSIQLYVMSWCRFDPIREIKKLKIPTLIIQGTTDLQITLDDADKLKRAKSNSSLTIIHGMNHILKDAPADRTENLATYNKPDLPLNAEFVTTITDYIKGLK